MDNKFQKICPNVWGMMSENEYARGDLAYITTKYGKEVEVEVYNVLSSENNAANHPTRTRAAGERSE